jgi:hypothetical protein
MKKPKGKSGRFRMKLRFQDETKMETRTLQDEVAVSG